MARAARAVRAALATPAMFVCAGRQGSGCAGGKRGKSTEAGTALKTSRLSQLMTKGGGGVLEDVNVSVSLSGKYPASHTFPDDKLLQQKSQTRLRTGQARGLARTGCDAWQMSRACRAHRR